MPVAGLFPGVSAADPKETLKKGEGAVDERFISGTGVSLCRGVPVQSDDAA
ncbi:MAG: hypothetical protein HQK99_01755 [Nitrospirae bacterium]|nr:hypothetical protein [Nitrospirota bacterium]